MNTLVIEERYAAAPAKAKTLGLTEPIDKIAMISPYILPKNSPSTIVGVMIPFGIEQVENPNTIKCFITNRNKSSKIQVQVPSCFKIFLKGESGPTSLSFAVSSNKTFLYPVLSPEW